MSDIGSIASMELHYTNDGLTSANKAGLIHFVILNSKS